jgi:small ligand-binding sensory domain FIST
MGRYGDGIGIGVDLVQAAETAARAALAPLGGRTPDLALAFVSGPEAGAAGERALAVTGAGRSLGCSAEGVLGGGVGVQGVGAVSVWVGVLPGVGLRSFHLEVLPAEGASAVVGIPATTGVDEVMLLLADPFSFPAHGFVEQAATSLPGLPIVGALAHGPAGPGSTRLWLDGRTIGRGAVGVVLEGSDGKVLVSQGCRAVGPVMTVTAATDGVVRGLAGMPAIEKVREVVGDLPPPDQALASQQLYVGVAAREETDQQDFLVRTLLGTERGTGGLILAERVKVGQTLRLHVRDADAAHDDLVARVPTSLGAGALLFSDTGRGAGLFGPSYGGVSHDLVAVREGLGADAVAGFFSSGVIGPVDGNPHLHGFSASVLVLP